MRAGLLVNPSSGKSSGKGMELAAKLRGARDVSVKVLERFQQLPGALDDFARDGVTHLFISSGDGTVHAVQTELAERRPFARLPILSLLPHGTTNMTAGDLGFRRRSLEAQRHFIATLEPAELCQRPALRAVNPRDGRPRQGMCIGTGAVAEGTAFCQEAFNANGIKGNLASFATLASAFGKAIFTKADPSDPSRFDRPFQIEVSAGGIPITRGSQLLAISTTLNRLVLGTRPFWGEASGPIRSTVICYPTPSVLRWSLPVLFGVKMRRGPPGCFSFNGPDLAITSATRFVLDGEFFEGPAEGPLQVETGATFTYARG